jgi:hypothetical protein
LAEMANPNLNGLLKQPISHDRPGNSVHPAWLRLMRYCADLGYGEIEKLKIQDGLPMTAELTTKKVKFNP